MKFYLRLILWATAIYLIIFTVASLYNHYIYQPSNALQATLPINSTEGKMVNATVTALANNNKNNAGIQWGLLEVIAGEITILSICILLEMKFKIFSRLLGNRFVVLASYGLILGIFAAIFISASGWLAGILATFIFIGLWLFLMWLLKSIQKQLFAAIILFISLAICWELLEPAAYLITSSISQGYIIKALFAIPLVIFGVWTIWRLKKGISLKNTLNLATFVASLGTSIYFGLVISIWFIVGLLVIMAIYDFIAVFVIRTMQFLAAKMTKSLAPVVFLFGNEKSLNRKLVNLGKGRRIRGGKKDNDSGILGGGDILIPSSVFCSAIFYLPAVAPFLLVGAILGIIACGLVMEYGGKLGQRGLPALVFLCPSILVMLGIGLLVVH